MSNTNTLICYRNKYNLVVIKYYVHNDNNKQRMMELVYRAWDNISWKVMDKSWACFFNNLRSTIIMRCRGDNNYKLAHNQGEKRQKDTGTAVDLSVNYEDYIACKDILARYNA